jgi:phosphoadenosine phosphosulfate reductase
MTTAANTDIWGQNPAEPKFATANGNTYDDSLSSSEGIDPKHARLVALRRKFEGLSAFDLVAAVIEEFGTDKIALFSSFGSYSALLLDVVGKANPQVPVLFLETGKHFPETLQYVEDIKNLVGLKNLRKLIPDEKIVNNADKAGDLWSFNVDRCCWIRKVEPLDREMKEAAYEAIITGRRSYQTQERSTMQVIELDDQGIFKINPFAFWSKDEVKAEFNKRGLPQHPLVDKGYPSIGCAPCTKPVKAGEDERSGRWAHLKEKGEEQKVECGIHLNREDIKDWVI